MPWMLFSMWIFYLQNSSKCFSTSNIDIVLCKFLSTLPKQNNLKMINVILGDEMDFAECLHKIDHPIILETINDLKDIKYRRSLNYLFVSGAGDLRKFQQKFSSKLFHNRGYYVMIMLAMDVEIEEFFKWFWMNQILNVNLLYSGLGMDKFWILLCCPN
ncbi:hypothetical protein ACKWTF_010224 [Chironomus riparius]